MRTKYTFTNLVNNIELRSNYMRDYDKLIGDLKRAGHTTAAIKHAKNKKRILQELELADDIAHY